MSSSGPDGAGERVEELAEQAQDSAVVEGLSRLGLLAKGVVWVVLAVLAARVATGDGSAEADQTGALRALASQPLGGPLLAVLAVGFAGHAVGLGLDAAVGHEGEEHRARHRAESALRCAVHAALAVSVLRFVVGGGGGGGQEAPESVTAALLGAPGGRSLVAVAGVAVVAVGAVLVVRAVRGSHEDRIRTFHLPPGTGRAVVHVGTVGNVGRGAVLALIGAFLLRAAWRADPDEAKGLDAALQALVDEPWGPVALWAAVVGLLAHGLWSFLEAALHRHR